MINYIVIAVYLLLLLIFTNVYRRRSNKEIDTENTDKRNTSRNEFTLAGKKMRTFPVLVSILATETSAASLLLFPDLGFNPAHRFIFLQLVVGMIIGRLLSAYLLIGPIYKSGKESIYEILKDKFSNQLANLSSVLYTIATILAAGVRLFIGAIALSILLGGQNNYNHTDNLQITIFIVLAGSIAVYYSQKGGLRGVIYTDNFQFLLILVALFAVLAMNVSTLDLSVVNWHDFIRVAPPDDSTWYSFTYSLPLAFLGGVVLSLGSHGIDQTTIQRVLAQRSEREARKSIIYSAFVIGPFVFLFILAGFIISQVNEVNNMLDTTQYVYPWYMRGLEPSISNVVSNAVNNLLENGVGNVIKDTTNSMIKISWLVAITSLAFLSAAMSSIDSALHSIATSIKQTNFKFVKKIPLKRLTLFSGLTLITSALVFQFIKWMQPNAMLISLALGATGMIFSPMAALYLMIYYFPDRSVNLPRSGRLQRDHSGGKHFDSKANSGRFAEHRDQQDDHENKNDLNKSDGQRNTIQKYKSLIALISLITGIACNLVIFAINNFFQDISISWLLSLVLSFFITILMYSLMHTFLQYPLQTKGESNGLRLK